MDTFLEVEVLIKGFESSVLINIITTEVAQLDLVGHKVGYLFRLLRTIPGEYSGISFRCSL